MKLRVLVVCEAAIATPALRADLQAGLGEAGCEVLAVLPAGIEVIVAVDAMKPDLIIIEAESSWRDALEHVCVATRRAPRPIVLFTDNPDTSEARQAISAGVTGYVVAGLAPERIKPVLEIALARFEIEQSMRDQLTDAREKLADRKLTDRAKGILMDKLKLSEEEAYRRLRRLAMDRKETLRAAAERVIDAAQLLT